MRAHLLGGSRRVGGQSIGHDHHLEVSNALEEELSGGRDEWLDEDVIRPAHLPNGSGLTKITTQLDHTSRSELPQTSIIVISKQHLAQIGRIDGPTEYLS